MSESSETPIVNAQERSSSDKPETYLASSAYNQAFDHRISELSEKSISNSTKRIWYEDPEFGEILCVTGGEKRDTLLIAANDFNTQNSFGIELRTKDLSQRRKLENYIDLVSRTLPSEQKINAISRLRTLDLDQEVESHLTSILSELVGINVATLRGLSLMAANNEIPVAGWRQKQIEPLLFDLTLFIESPISDSNPEDIYSEVKKRLDQKAARPTPDKDFIEHRTKFQYSKAEYVDSRSIMGGVDTNEHWGDILKQRRPMATIVELTKSLQQDGLRSKKDDEIRLFRIKESQEDKGKLFVDEGNHRVAVLTALGVTKFPAMVQTVMTQQRII